MKHADKAYHKEAVVKADEFLKVMTNQQPDNRSRLNQEMADRVQSNRQKLASIFDTIVFCGRQNVPLRDGLDPINLRGQAYDGAGNMAGSVNGTAALINAQYPLAL